MKFKVGDTVIMKNGSEYKVIEVGSLDALGEYERVLIKGKTGLGYWVNPDDIDMKEAEIMTEDFQIGDIVTDKAGCWMKPSKVRAIEGNSVCVTTDNDGLAVFEKGFLTKAKVFPYTLTKEEMKAHLDKIGATQLMVNFEVIKRELFTITKVIELGPEYKSKGHKYRYVFGQYDSFVFDDSIGQDNGGVEYLWYKPHPLTETEKKILIKLHGSLKFKIKNWPNTTFEVIWYGHPGAEFVAKTMEAYRVKYDSTDDAQVPIASLEGQSAIDRGTCTWIDERQPPMKTEGIGYLKKGEGSLLYSGKDGGCYANFTDALGNMAIKGCKVKVTVEEIRE
jgi:hypothetical protein